MGGMVGDPDLDDPKALDKIAGDAVASEKLQQRGPDGEELSYAPNSQIPYTGWVKSMHKNGQVKALKHYKDGKKECEFHYKDGKEDWILTMWDKDGNVYNELHYNYKNDEEVKG